MPYFIGKSPEIEGKAYFFNPEKTNYLLIEDNGLMITDKSEDALLQIENIENKFTLKKVTKCELWHNGDETEESVTITESDLIDCNGYIISFYDNDFVQIKDSRVSLINSEKFVCSECDINAQSYKEKLNVEDVTAIIKALNSVNELTSFEKVLNSILKRRYKKTNYTVFITKDRLNDFQYLTGNINENCQLSKTVLNHVFLESKSILSQDIMNDPRFETSKSLHSQFIKSIMCSPLIFKDKPLGFIYLSSALSDHEFTEYDFSFLNFLAFYTSVTLHNLNIQNRFTNSKENLSKSLSRQYITESASMKNLIRKLKKIAPVDIPVLITGETGTGKEMLARMVHEYSLRSDAPFITINCACLSESLLESELFGHIKGSFTGAISDKKGKFLLADKGTVFLDEIAELPLSLQPKLLRAIQEKIFQPVGSNKDISSDIRFVAATNRNIREEVQKGNFREDLYFRLCGINLNIPPLRERISDIKPMAINFINEFCYNNSLLIPGTDETFFKSLHNYFWPGNIRELKSTIELAVTIAGEDTLTDDDLVFSIQPQLKTSMPEKLKISPYKESLQEFDLQYLKNVLQHTEGNVSMAAKISQLDRTYLHAKMKKYNIKSSDFKR